MVLQTMKAVWLTLSLSVGLGILLPILIPNRNVLFSFMLLVLLISIFLFSYLKTFKQPAKIFFLLIQTKTGHTLLEKHFLDSDLNTDLFSGAFNAMNVLFKESFGSDSGLRSLEYENKNVLLSASENLYSFIVTDRYDSSVRKSLIEISNLFEVSYYSRISNMSKLDNTNKSIKVDLNQLPEVIKQKILSLVPL